MARHFIPVHFFPTQQGVDLASLCYFWVLVTASLYCHSKTSPCRFLGYPILGIELVRTERVGGMVFWDRRTEQSMGKMPTILVSRSNCSGQAAFFFPPCLVSHQSESLTLKYSPYQSWRLTPGSLTFTNVPPCLWMKKSVLPESPSSDYLVPDPGASPVYHL